MNKHLSWTTIAFAALLTSCGQNSQSTVETAQPTQDQFAYPQETLAPTFETDATDSEAAEPDQAQNVLPEEPDQAQDVFPEEPETTRNVDTGDPEDEQTADVPDAPIEEANQHPVPKEFDAPAQQYEAESGEYLSSNAAIGNTMTPTTMHDYLTAVIQDVDSYWTTVWAQAGYQEPMVTYYFTAPGESYPHECGPTNDDTMHYCPGDDLIIFSQDLATRLWNGQYRVNHDPETGVASGDLSVAFLVAHEYAHNLQDELRLIPRTQEEASNRQFPVYKTELHADCWAGIWANSAYYKGYLQGGDVEEAMQAGRLVGDYQYTNPQHHGTPQQRVDAFMTGYNSGVPSTCDTWLLSNYGPAAG